MKNFIEKYPGAPPAQSKTNIPGILENSSCFWIHQIPAALHAPVILEFLSTSLQLLLLFPGAAPAPLSQDHPTALFPLLFKTFSWSVPSAPTALPNLLLECSQCSHCSSQPFPAVFPLLFPTFSWSVLTALPDPLLECSHCSSQPLPAVFPYSS